MKRIIIVFTVFVLLMGSTASGFNYANFMSKPTRFHVKVNSSLAIGRIMFDAWDNPEMPQLHRMPRIKVGFVPIVNGTEVWGTNLSRLLTNDGFSEYIAKNYPNLKTIEFGEQYEQFQGGELITTSKMYNAITNTGMVKETADRLAYEAAAQSVDWTIPGTQDNFEKIEVYPGYENRVNLGNVFSSELDRKTGRSLTAISQGFIPEYGMAEKPLDFTVCNPYTAIPVVYAEDQYMDYFFRPIGTIIEQDGGAVISRPSAQQACFVKFKYHDMVVSNIPYKKSADGIDEAELDLNVRYTGEYRFDFEVDPPQIGGQANLPLVSTGIGEASMYEEDGTQHFVQSFPSLRRFYKWLPHTNPGYSNQKLLITPAVRKKCFHESRLWELSHFKVFYPVARFEDGHQIVTEESVDVSPTFFSEISMGDVGYFRFTNLPWLEGKESIHYIYSVDRPMRIVAVYEPGDLTPRGKDVVTESTRITLNWGITNEMKKLAEIKSREWGENWWQKHFPTYYTVKVTGENGLNKTFKKIDPLSSTMIVDGLEPGKEYSWELETWVSDDNGSSSLMNTWKSEPVKTIPLPKLIGHCAKADAIKLETEVGSDGFEVWKITTPLSYKLGSAELKPMSFEARPSARMSPVRLNQLDMVDVSSDVKNLIAKVRIVDFTDNFEKNDDDENIIHVFFRPLRVQVKGVAVDELFKPIGAEVGGQLNQWWPAADGVLTESPSRMVTAPLMFKGKKMWSFKEWKWNGKIHATKAPFKDHINSTSIIMVKGFGCQDDPENPVELKMYAVYEEVEVDCFSLAVEYSVMWKPVDYNYKIPIAPKGDCPGDVGKYMTGTKVTVGPVPNEIEVDDLDYKFVGWIVGDQTYSGLSKLTVTMDSDKKVVANYQQSDSRFELKFYAILGSRNTRLDTKIFPDPDREGFYRTGETVEIGPVPMSLNNGEYIFSGWSVDGVIQPPSENHNMFSILMDGNHRVAAVYELAKKRR